MIVVSGEEQEGTDWADLEWIHPASALHSTASAA